MGVTSFHFLGRRQSPWRPSTPMIMWLFLFLTLTLKCFAERIGYIPDCVESACSDDVDCSIRVDSGSCTVRPKGDLNIAASAERLTVTNHSDAFYRYINLEWRPPADGSYRDLTGFHLSVATTHNFGQEGMLCFQIQLGENWTQAYTHHKSVSFYFRCLRVPKTINPRVTVRISSQPENPANPKVLLKHIYFKSLIDKGDTVRWVPKYSTWADGNNVLHVVLENPLESAGFYQLQLGSEKNEDVAYQVTLPAVQNSSEMAMNNPHFTIANLSIDDRYSIWMQVFFPNKTMIPEISLHTSYFSPNFTVIASNTESPEPDVAKVPSKKAALDGAVIAVVLVTALLVLLALFLLAVCWRLHRHPQGSRLCLLCWVCDPTHHSQESMADSKILPVYCDEDEPFVHAVESHVNLLKKYANAISLQDQKSNSPICRCLCSIASFSWLYGKSKSNDAIIYLSPRLAKIARLRNIDDLEGVTDLDRHCHNALLSLRHKQKSCRERISMHLVTFDCFHGLERDCLRALGILANIGVSSLEEQRYSEPMKLASFSSESPKLINFETLLFQLCQLRDSPRSLPPDCWDWHETQEALDTESFLAQLSPLYIGEESVDLVVGHPHDEALPESDNRSNGVREEIQLGEMIEKRVHPDFDSVHYLKNTDPVYSDELLDESSLTSQCDIQHSKENLGKNKTKLCHNEIQGNISETPVLKEIPPNSQSGSNGAHVLSSIDSGYISKPFVNPRFEEMRFQKKCASSSRLSDDDRTSWADNSACPSYDSDSDNNEYAVTNGALESDKLLCVKDLDNGVTIRGSPLSWKRKNKGCHPTIGHQVIPPPNFLPKLTDANSSISDLISGINDKTAWQ